MSTGFNKRLATGWVILAGLTVCYLWIDRSAEHNGAFQPSTAVTVTAIVIALVKARIILREFMEVRHAPAFLCHLTDLWVVLIAVALITSYLAGRTAVEAPNLMWRWRVGTSPDVVSQRRRNVISAATSAPVPVHSRWRSDSRAMCSWTCRSHRWAPVRGAIFATV